MESQLISRKRNRSTLWSHVVQPSANAGLFPKNILLNLLLFQSNQKSSSLSFHSSWPVWWCLGRTFYIIVDIKSPVIGFYLFIYYYLFYFSLLCNLFWTPCAIFPSHAITSLYGVTYILIVNQERDWWNESSLHLFMQWVSSNTQK